MPFDSQSRIFAFPASALQNLQAITELHGEELSDMPANPSSPRRLCIVGGIDREGSSDLRSTCYMETAAPIPLIDGRFAYSGHWSLSLIDAVNAGQIEAEELSEEQFKSLILSLDP
jgi:hypothetical protein